MAAHHLAEDSPVDPEAAHSVGRRAVRREEFPGHRREVAVRDREALPVPRVAFPVRLQVWVALLVWAVHPVWVALRGWVALRALAVRQAWVVGRELVPHRDHLLGWVVRRGRPREWAVHRVKILAEMVRRAVSQERLQAQVAHRAARELLLLVLQAAFLVLRRASGGLPREDPEECLQEVPVAVGNLRRVPRAVRVVESL